MLPPSFTYDSHHMPYQVHSYSSSITSGLRHSLITFAFGVQLQDVFIIISTCVSHQPTTFCKFPSLLLFLFTAFISITLQVYYLARYLSNLFFQLNKGSQIASFLLIGSMAEQIIWVTACTYICYRNIFQRNTRFHHNKEIRHP